ncbi:ATPase V, partial [archaeon]|nr:ATPase V [archaeon]
MVIKLHKEKQEATKLKKKAEIQIKASLSAEKRSSSTLHSIDKKIESEREKSSDVSSLLARKTSQLESIERLIVMAQEKLNQEKENVEQAEQEIEFAENPDEKKSAEVRLHSLNEHVQEIVSEIKDRQKTAKKISDDVENYAGIQSKINSQIQKQTRSKPSLRETMIASRKSIKIMTEELEKQTRAEESAKISLDKVFSRLQKTSKTAAKRKPAKKAAAKRKPAKKAAAKRKPAKKAAAKRKPAKKA